MVLVVFLALAANYTVFSQAVAIDAALSNAAKETSENVPKGAKIAILNISSDSVNLSDYIINELIANLINARLFQIIPRSTVEMEAAKGELDFQMSGYVSDESQKRLGQFLGADTIITGTVTRDSANSYRLVVNTIHLESFTYLSSYRISIRDDTQMKAVVAGSAVFYQDYTVGERLGMGGLNMVFGLGSLLNGHPLGWITTLVEGSGVAVLVIGLFMNPTTGDTAPTPSEWTAYQTAVQTRTDMITAGTVLIGAGVLYGFVIPFFHHKPNNTRVSQNNLPFNLELVSSNNQEINGFRVSYNMRF
jgi:TolB-like protein